MESVYIDDERLFELTNVSYEEGRELLTDGEITGILRIYEDESFSLIINNSNIPQEILRQFLDGYKQQMNLIQSELEQNPDLLISGWLGEFDNFQNYIEQMPVNETSNDTIIIAYYSAIAMTCLFGAMLAASGMKNMYAKLSKVGARVTLSPYSKFKMIFLDFIASTLLILLAQTMLILYLNYVIGISFTTQIGAIALIIFMGSIASTAFGYAIVLITKTDSYISGITMLWSFMAGMMMPEIVPMIENVIPFAKYINPVALITDSFQRLMYFDDFSMIIPYLVALLVWTVVCLLITSVILRRERYDSV